MVINRYIIYIDSACVNKSLTLNQFGDPKNCKSKIVTNCECGNNCVTDVRQLQKYFESNTKYKCVRYKRQKFLKQIDGYFLSDKTISEFGVPNSSKSKVFVRCSCDALCVMRVGNLRKSIEYYGKYVCHSCSIKQSFDSIPGKRQRNSEISKRITGTPEFKKKMSLIMTRLNGTEEHKQLMASAKNQPTYKLNQAISLEKFRKSGKDSRLERVAQNLLDSINIKWERQYRIGHYSFDLFLPDYNYLIEIQGEYWHSHNHAKQNDASKHTYINSYFPQYKVLYLYERDFINPDKIKEILINNLLQKTQDSMVYEFDYSCLEIKRLNQDEKLPNSYYSQLEEFLQSYHPSGVGKKSRVTYGLFLNNNLISVGKFSSVRKKNLHDLDITPSMVLDLERVCIHPNYRKTGFLEYAQNLFKQLVFDEFHDIQYILSSEVSAWEKLCDIKYEYYVDKNGYVTLSSKLEKHSKSLKIDFVDYANKHGYRKESTFRSVYYCHR